MNFTRYFRGAVVGIYGKIHSKAFHVTSQRTTTTTTTATSSLAEIKFRPYKSSLKAATAKKPKREPFVPRFFMGEIDEALFVYPEMASEHLKRLNDMVSVVHGFYNSNINKPSDIGSLGELPGEVLNGLKSMGLFGQQVPKMYGGLELGAFEMNRFAEVICQNPAIFHLINFHNLYGVNMMLSAGTEAQKQLYLPKLASGETILGVCIWEKNSGSDLSSIETKAEAFDAKSYAITGTKIWATNIDLANELLVLADLSPKGSKNNEKELCFFLVNKNSPGVTVKKVEVSTVEQLGTYEVSFNGTVVKEAQMVGKRGSGFELANSAIFPRTSVMPSAITQTLRMLFNEVVNHVLTREQFGQPLFNFDSVKWKLGQASVRLYVLESMAYLTAGLYNEYEDQNTVVECAITKVHALDTLHFCLNTFSDIFGSQSLQKDFAPMKYFKDAAFYNVCEGTKDVTKMHISLHCLRYLGNRTHEHVHKIRNPLHYPIEKWKDYRLTVENSRDSPTLTRIVSENVHPSLEAAADTLEYCIVRLRWVADLNIIHFGAEITHHQHVMLGLADIVTECYAMSAAIARASRSYCIGLKNADLEVQAAHTYVTENLARVRQLIEWMDPHLPPIYHGTMFNLAEAIGIKKGYFAEHPLERTYL